MMHILLVEDHEFVRRGVKQTLLTVFPEATFGEASTLPEAIELLMKESWSLILLDLNLPGRSGFELLQESRRLCSNTPVLVLSTYAEDEFAVRAIKLGAAGYLTKTSAADELLIAVKKVLSGGHYVTAALAEGLAVTLGASVAQAPHEVLSERELQVLQLVAAGKTIKAILVEMNLGEKTVATY